MSTTQLCTAAQQCYIQKAALKGQRVTTSVWATHAKVVFNYYLLFKQTENTQIQPALFLDKIVSFMDIYSTCPVLQNSIFLHLICNTSCFKLTLIHCVIGILLVFCISQAADQYSAMQRKKKNHYVRILLQTQTDTRRDKSDA